MAAVSWQPPPARLALEAGAVHVWCVPLSVQHATATLRAVLSADELAQAGRFMFERDRRAFVAVRGALRVLLGRYLARRPERLELARQARGKPYLAEPGAACQFNVSHSGELGLLAFARDRELGVDVEVRTPGRDWLALAEQSFTVAEIGTMRSLPEADRAAAFYTCWARKEAFIKATGQGVSQLRDVEVTLRPGEPAELLRAPTCDWSIHDLPALPDHAAALVVAGTAPRLSCWRWDASASVAVDPATSSAAAVL